MGLLPKNGGQRVSGVRGALLVAGPKILNGAAIFAVNLLLMRRMSTADYGIFSVAAAGLILFDAFLGAALDLSVLRTASVEHRRGPGLTSTERWALEIKLALAAVMLAVAAIGGESLGRLVFHTPDGRALFLMLALGGSALLLLRSVQVYFQSQLRFAWYGATDVLHTLTRVSLVLVALRATLATPTALLGCYALAPLLIVAAFSRVLWLRADYHASPAKSRRHLLRFAGTAFVTIALSAVIGRLDLFMTQVAGNSVEAGLFGAAMVIALIPEMIGSYLTPVFSPRIIRWRQQGTLYSFYRSFQILLWIACAVGLAAALLFSGKIIPLVFPARFAGSSQIVQVLLPGAFAGLVTFPLTLSLLTFFAPRTFIVFDSISLPFLAGGYYLLAQSHGALGVAFLSSISRVVKMLYLQVVAIRVARRIGRQSIPASMSPALCPVPAGD